MEEVAPSIGMQVDPLPDKTLSNLNPVMQGRSNFFEMVNPILNAIVNHARPKSHHTSSMMGYSLTNKHVAELDSQLRQVEQ